MREQRIPARPVLSRGVAALLNKFNYLCDIVYHSEYNPFYRSGTLAIGLLFVLLATGFYLLFFYDVSSPYESIGNIQGQVWLGRWMRALHRYATDAALIAVFFHFLQLLAQGKTWGPRTLAWVSGVVLLIALFVSAWTGYVMVWDRHAQVLALAGLKLFQALPIFNEDIAQAFSGKAPVPASFFFMNLFLHVAVPLGMVFGMWIHTARLARTVWIPITSIFYATVLGLFIASLLVPAVMLPEADLLSVVGRIEADWWYLFWVPFIDSQSAETVLMLWCGILLALISVPWWWKPSKASKSPISSVIEDECTGCTQCARDCPYEAIKMVPHSNGKHLLAEVSPVHCVSCGICAASCDVLAVGPADRASKEQIANFESFCRENLAEASDNVVIVGCVHNDSVPDYLEELAGKEEKTHYIGLNCCGTLHSTSLELLLENCGGVMLSGCAARNCMNRDGLELLKGRIYGKRVPILDRKIDRERIVVAPHSEREKAEIKSKLQVLRKYINKESETSQFKYSSISRLSWFLKRSLASALLIGLVVIFNQTPLGATPDFARLRVAGRLPGELAEKCRGLTKEEKAELPVHMQKQEICERRPISYQLTIKIDQQVVLEETLLPASMRGDLPVHIGKELDVSPGSRRVQVTAKSLIPGDSQNNYEFDEVSVLEVGKIKLIELP